MATDTTPTWRDLGMRTAAIIGLGASSFLLVDYLRPEPIFCDEGCDVVRLSEYASWLGIPTPVYGVAFFALALLLAVAQARRPLLVLSLAGAFAAAAFIGLQLFVLKVICPYCMVVDVAALAMLAFLIVSPAPRPEDVSWRAGFVLAGIVAAALPFGIAWARTRPPVSGGGTVQAQLPEPIAREQKPGVLTVVEFVDFECPICRRLHAALKEEVARFPAGKVRIVRKHRPLRSIHAGADVAARAACCASERGKGDAVADALFELPADQLTADGVSALAGRLGLDAGEFRSCLDGDKAKACVAADEKDAEAAGVPMAVPFFWVGKTMFKGFPGGPALRAALEAAATSP